MSQYQPPPYPGAAPPEDPGKTLGVVGLILSFFTALIGMIISIVAFRRSKKAGFNNGIALAGIIVGGLTTLASIIVTAVLIAGIFAVADRCKSLGSGVHEQNGVTITCR